MLKLTAIDGKLHTSVTDAEGNTEYRLLLCIYSAGDCDTISASRPNEKNLRRALYDARETGDLPDQDGVPVSEVTLPNGKVFAF